MRWPPSRAGRRGEDRPGSFGADPEVVEHDGVLISVHTIPEALVPEGAQLALLRQALERLALKDAAGVDVAERLGLETEEAAVDPVLAARLLDEALDPVVGPELGDAPLQIGTDHGHGRKGAVPLMRLELGGKVDV